MVSPFLDELRKLIDSYEMHEQDATEGIRLLKDKLLRLRKPAKSSKWIKVGHWNDEFDQLAQLASTYKDLFTMPYPQFLETRYWKAVRAYKICHQPTCELCGSAHNLRVHHETYKHRGFEYSHLADLTVTCEPCHSKIHGI